MNGVELFLLGRALMRIGEDALPPLPDGARAQGSARVVLIVLSDVVAHPDSAVGEIAERTGLPQSQVSTAVARLREAGSVDTGPDPTDRRRLLVRRAAGVSPRVAEVRGSGVDGAVAAALGTEDPRRIAELVDALDVVAGLLAGQPPVA